MTKHETPEDVNIFDLQELAMNTPDMISLGLGDPDIGTPEHIIEAAKQAILKGRTGPAPSRGLPELRQAVARKLQRVNDITVDPER